MTAVAYKTQCFNRIKKRRDLKKKRGEPGGAKDYREIKRKIRTDENGKRDLDTASMPGRSSTPQKE